MVKHNNQVPNVHLKKDWDRRVKTWFDQPGKKKSRRIARDEKAKRIFPRPTGGLLRPVVHAPTRRYNMKVRAGRGFTLAELKEAGIGRKEALGLGIAVDSRRRNRSDRSLQENVQRLRAYRSKLVVFPRKRTQQKAGDSTAEECKTATQFEGKVGGPVRQRSLQQKARAITADEKKQNVFLTLRRARADARLIGVRAERAKKAAEEAALAKGKGGKKGKK